MPDACVVGVDLGGTKLLAGTLDSKLDVHHRAHRFVAGMDWPDLLETLVDAIEEVRSGNNGEVIGVGCGIPALIDLRTGVAIESNHLSIVDVDVAGLLSERLGLPVVLDNDGNLAALAEQRFGAARETRHVVLMTIGTGIGGGLVLDGSVYHGRSGAAGDLGHVVVEASGRPCPGSCPGRGCLEAYVSGPALGLEGARLAAEQPRSALGRAVADGAEVTGALVTELAADGDAAAVEAVRVVGEWLGVGLVTLVNALNPEIVVIGGGVIAAGDLLLDPAREVVATRALPFPRSEVEIVKARFGAEAGMVGAAVLAFESLRQWGGNGT